MSDDDEERTFKVSIGKPITMWPGPDHIDHVPGHDVDAQRETAEADGYLGQRIKYKPPERTGYTSIPVLEFLAGQPWDAMALNYIHSLRPSYLRVVWGSPVVLNSDGVDWRVTVFLDGDGRTIRRMSQEVSCGLRGSRTGHDLYAHRSRIK